jgi:hypothetical protein
MVTALPARFVKERLPKSKLILEFFMTRIIFKVKVIISRYIVSNHTHCTIGGRRY